MTAPRKQLVTRAELAQRASVTRAAITLACKKKLAPACEGDRINLRHPVVVAYLEAKGVAAPPPKRSRKRPKTRAAHPADERLDSTDPAGCPIGSAGVKIT